MSVSAVEYFAVLGRKRGPLTPRLFKGVWGDQETVSPLDIWEDAITDIAVVRTGLGEAVSADWELVMREGGEEAANCNGGDASREVVHLAIMRRRNSKKSYHISDMFIWQSGDSASLPEGYSLADRSISGSYTGDLNVGGAITYIAYNRSQETIESPFCGSPLIDDISIFLSSTKSEEYPENYIIIDKNLNKGSRGDKLFLGYHQRGPMGICDLRYEYSTLDRYPLVNHNGLELPVNELPMFTFPHDLRVRKCSKLDFPLPSFFTFVFTDVTGRHLHAACLRFFEVVPFEEVLHVASTTFNKPIESFKLGDDMLIVCPKVICVLSQMPFYRAMGRFLRQLYSLSLSPMVCPIESFLASTVAKVPLPLCGGRPYHIILDAALISITSKSMPPICLSVPSERFFPPMDLDFAAPLRCLSVENILTVFCLLLKEEKVVFLCRSNALLTEVMETFRSLLFPLKWSSCFITRLPDSLCALLEAPGGLMIGLHVTEIGELNKQMNSSSRTKTLSYVKVGNKNYEKMGGWSRCLQPGTFIVDLSENSVLLFEGRVNGNFNTSKVGSNVIKVLPSGPRRRIEQKLNAIAAIYALGPQTDGLDQFDSPFEIVGTMNSDGSQDSRNWELFPTLVIRDAFAVLMADILGNFSLYIIPPSKDINSDEYRSFKDEFSVEKYISDAEKSCRQLLSQLVETQMFSVLLQLRSEGPENMSLEFFESLSHVLNISGLSALSSSDKRFDCGNAIVPSLQLVELPAPLHVLYSTYFRLMHMPSVHKAVQGIHSAGSAILRAHSGKNNGYGNKLLDELMIHLLTPEFRPPPSDSAHLELDINTLREKSRYELETFEMTDDVLSDITKGQLLLPGPFQAVTGAREETKYTRYNDGWPFLDEQLLSVEVCHPQLENLAKAKKREIVKRMNHILAIAPSVEERVSLLSVSPLVYPVRSNAMSRAIITDHSDSKTAVSMISDVFSVSLTSLSVKAMSQGLNNPFDLISAIFEIFGVLAHAEGMGLLPFMEERVLRSVLIACSSVKADSVSDYSFFHAACCVMFDLIRFGCGISCPSSLTYGAYCSALSRFKTLQLKLKKRGAPSIAYSRSSDFSYMQELGAAWFAGKSQLYYPSYGGADPIASHSTETQITPEKHYLRRSNTEVPVAAVTSDYVRSPAALEHRSPTSPKPLWSRFSASWNNRDHSENSKSGLGANTKFTMRIGDPALSRANELGLCSSNSALFSLLHPKCASEYCSNPACLCGRELDGSLVRMNYAGAESLKSQILSDLVPFGPEDLADYIVGLRNKVAEPSIEKPANLLAPISEKRLVSGPGKIRITGAQNISLQKQYYTSGAVGHIVTYYIDIYSSCSIGRIFTIVLTPDRNSDRDIVTFSAKNFAGAEIFTEAVGIDLLHFELKRVQIDSSSSTTPPDVILVGHGTLKISEMSEYADKESLLLRATSSVHSDSVGSIEISVQCQAMDSFDEDDSNHEVKSIYQHRSLSPKTGDQTLKNVFGLKAADTSVSKSSTPSDGSSRWTDKAFSMFKSKLQQSPMDKKQSLSTNSSPVKFSSGQNAESKHDVIELPHPLALLESNDAPQNEVLKTVETRPAIDVEDIVGSTIDLVLEKAPSNIVFGNTDSDTNNLLDALTKETVKPSNCAGPEIQDIDVELKNQDPKVEKKSGEIRRSILKPLSRSSLTAGDIPKPDDDVETIKPVIDLTAIESETSQELNELDGIASSTSPPQTFSQRWSEGIRADGNEKEDQSIQSSSPSVADIDHKKKCFHQLPHVKSIESALQKGELLAMFSETKCEDCGSLFLDSDIVGRWGCSSQSLQAISKTNSLVVSLRIDTLRAAHRVKCQICNVAAEPKLNIKCYRVSSTTENEKMHLTEKWSKDVVYLSPFSVRVIFEHLVSIYGFDISKLDFLRTNHPDIFWNLMWYSKRLQLPIGFDLENLDSVIVGWQEKVVRARIEEVFKYYRASSIPDTFKSSVCGDSCNRSTTVQMVSRYFPESPIEILLLLANVADHDLDGTVNGMRRAILLIYPHIDEIISRKNCSVHLYTAKARNVYMCLLILCNCTPGGEKLLKVSNNMPADLERGSTFDLIYPQALGAINGNDMKDLGTTAAELFSGVDRSNLSKCIRIAFGVVP